MDNTTLSTTVFENTTFAFDGNATVTSAFDSNVNMTTVSRKLPATPPPPGYYGDIRLQLWKILPPIIMTWGISGNILSCIILFRLARRSGITSTTLYLTALAISDTIILLCGPLRNMIKFIWEKDIRYLGDASCKSQLYFTYLSIHFSSWILVAITMERVASVVFPHKVKIGCTPRNASVTIFSILLVLGCLNLVHPIIQRLDSGRNSIRCGPSNPEYTKFRDDVYIWIDFFLSFGGPFVFLLVGNAIIIYRLNKSRLRQKQMNVSRGDGKSSGRDMKSLTILLICLSAIFLLTMTPVNIFTVYYPYRFQDILDMKDPYKQYYAYQYILYQHAVVNVVGYTNASFNFILYILTGSKFRKEFIDMFRCASLCRKKPRSFKSASDTKQTALSASDSNSRPSVPALTVIQNRTSENGEVPQEMSSLNSKQTEQTIAANKTTETDNGIVAEVETPFSHKDAVVDIIDETSDMNKDVEQNNTDQCEDSDGHNKTTETDNGIGAEVETPLSHKDADVDITDESSDINKDVEEINTDQCKDSDGHEQDKAKDMSESVTITNLVQD